MTLELLKWVVGAPLAGAAILFVWRGIPDKLAAVVGAGSVFVAAVLTALVTPQFLAHPEPYTQTVWTWFSVGGLAPRMAFYLDGLSLNMLWVITGVGGLIHLFAVWYMRGDAGYRRFFAYMNLFVAAMTLLVLGDSLLTLYFGWEGVGLCSYLLIGFWYQDAANGDAARKAFVVTRVGDTLMAIGLFLLFKELGTLDIQDLMRRAASHWIAGAPIANAVGLLILGGAVGKSAQLPLQTWLPDAMAGPTPVSALIHAATMVTAGVYLVARLHGVYALAPLAQETVGWVGALTLLLAGGAALFQRDIKRILAYSTMSQIGYMFLALGAGAWSAAIFHLMTHAFFKALLFLSAGAVILALHHEQDIFKMGGLRRKLPLAFWCFVVGSGALAAVPYITAGYYSKDEILLQTYAGGHLTWWLMGLAGAGLTGLYIFRLVFVVFGGEAKTEAHDDRAWTQRVPLALLLILSVVGGWFMVPAAQALPAAPGEAHESWVIAVQIAVSLAGIALAWLLYARGTVTEPRADALAKLGLGGWGFDWLYDRLFVRPWWGIARVNRADVADQMYSGVVAAAQAAHRASIQSQNGRIRWYAAGFAMGLVLFVATVLWSA